MRINPSVALLFWIWEFDDVRRTHSIGALLLSQFGLLAALNFQLFWVVTAYKMIELKRNLSQQERRICKEREDIFKLADFMAFLTASYCLTLICSEVDVFILDLSFEIRETMNKILSFIALIPLKSLLLLSGSHIVSCFFSPGWNSVSIKRDFFRFSGPFGRAESLST